MTQPPFDTGGTPPGFQPQQPWSDRPLAATKPPSAKKFLLVMAFFATLFVVSVAGFVVTAKDDIGRAVPDFSGGGGPLITATPGPREDEPEEPPGEGPVPKSVTYTGNGNKVVKIRRPERGDAIVYLKGRPGGALFKVSGLTADGTPSGFVVVAFEPYEGVRMLDVTSHLRTTQLEIEAAGPWTVQVRSVRAAKAFGRSVSGSGDSVLRYTGGSGVATIRGGVPMRPFTVTARVDGFPRLLVTEVGAYDGEKVWPKGPHLVEVQATGRWSIRVR